MDLNQQENLHKWCKDIFGITCDQIYEGNCPGICKLSHDIHDPDTMLNKLIGLNESELQQTYLFAESHEITFKKNMEFFVYIYSTRKQVDGLLDILNGCKRYPNCWEQLLTPIYNSLMECGFTGPLACTEIASRFLDQPNLFAIPKKLLDTIADIIMSAGWIPLVEFVVKMLKITNYKFPPSHLSTILDSNDFESIIMIIEALSMIPILSFQENIPKVKKILYKQIAEHNTNCVLT